MRGPEKSVSIPSFQTMPFALCVWILTVKDEFILQHWVAGLWREGTPEHPLLRGGFLP